MKTTFLTLLILFSSYCFSQTKEELINAIVKINSLDGYDGYDDSNDSVKVIDNNKIESNNYYNFEKLKRLISYDELFELTKHRNNVLKLYAIQELIERHDKKLDIFNLFKMAIVNDIKVRTHEGCIVDSELIYSVLYHAYWNNVRNKSTDSLMIKIDSYLIGYDRDIYWLIYERIFSNRKYSNEENKNIIKMIYKFNNSYAFNYLNKCYPKIFDPIAKSYFLDYFPKQNFNSESQVSYLFAFTEYVFENQYEHLKPIILNKLKETNYWKMRLGWFQAKIFEKYNIKI
ncbi:MAG: hypothetical protein ABI472_24990 [Ginsengibacter sp.]